MWRNFHIFPFSKKYYGILFTLPLRGNNDCIAERMHSMNAPINIKYTEMIHVLPLIIFLNITFLFYAKQMDNTYKWPQKRILMRFLYAVLGDKLLPAPHRYYSYSFFLVRFYKITQKELHPLGCLLVSVKKISSPKERDYNFSYNLQLYYFTSRACSTNSLT